MKEQNSFEEGHGSDNVSNYHLVSSLYNRGKQTVQIKRHDR